MHVEVDQSVKMEYTRQATVLALANGKTYTIQISATTKQACIHHLRERGIKPPQMQVRLFATALYFLLKDHIAGLQSVTIDIEYQGHNEQIKTHLMNLLRRAGTIVSGVQIIFRLVGKQSPAHKASIEVTRRKKQPDQVIGLADMLDEL